MRMLNVLETERRDVTYQFLTTLLPSMPLSDVCLRVYFSEDYSDADFIILNAALSCELLKRYLSSSFIPKMASPETYTQHHRVDFSDTATGEEQGETSSPTAFEHRSLCRQNLDAAISRLPLHLPASFSMVLALILAVCSASKPLPEHASVVGVTDASTW